MSARSRGRISLKKAVLVMVAVVVVIVLIKCTVGYISAVFGTFSQQDAAEFLRELGWDIKTDTAYSAEIVIPAEFSDVYERYNRLQQKQGYDLSLYKGEKVTRYTFEVLNFSEYDGSIAESAEAHVLVSGGSVIGGDLCSMSLGGLMTGFKGESF